MIRRITAQSTAHPLRSATPLTGAVKAYKIGTRPKWIPATDILPRCSVMLRPRRATLTRRGPRSAPVFHSHSQNRNCRSGPILSKAGPRFSLDIIATACAERSALDLSAPAWLPCIAHRAIREWWGCRPRCAAPAERLSMDPRGGRSLHEGGAGRRQRRVEGRDWACRCATAIGAL